MATLVARWDVIAFFVVCVIAVVVRMYRLDGVPGNLTADEADFYQNVFGVLERGRPHLLGFDWTGAPGLGVHLMAYSVRLFGASVYGLRMQSVILSVATLVPYYILARRTLTPVVALLTVLLLATSVWYLHFSRTAWTNMNSALFAVGMAAGLMLGLDRRGPLSWLSFAFAGVCAALGVYGYQSGHILPLLLVGFAPIAVLANWPQWRRVFLGFGLAVVVAVITAAPLLQEIHAHWGSYTGRSQTVSVFHNRSPHDVIALLPDQITHNFHGFVLLDNAHNVFRAGTEGPRYAPKGENFFDLVSRMLFFIGLIVGVWRWRRTALWWVMYLGPVVSIQLFTINTPDGARGIMVVPFIVLFMGLGLDTALRSIPWLVKRWRPRWEPRAAMAAMAFCLALASYVSAGSVRRYFDWMGEPYALVDRQPAVALSEFADWSRLQRASAAAGGFFNVGQWRESRDRAGCLRGMSTPGLCETFGLAPVTSPLGDTVTQPSELPSVFSRVSLLPITSDDFRRFNGDADKLRDALTPLTVSDGWSTLYRADGSASGATVSSTVARLDDASTARTVFDVRAGLKGGDILGGPRMEEVSAATVGDRSVLTRLELAGAETLELFWCRGDVIGQIQVRRPTNSKVVVSTEDLVALAQAQDQRMEAVASGRG